MLTAAADAEENVAATPGAAFVRRPAAIDVRAVVTPADSVGVIPPVVTGAEAARAL